MNRINIFKERVLVHEGRSGKWKEHPFMDGLPLSKVVDLTTLWRQYPGYLLRTQKIAARPLQDNYGPPFLHFYNIRFNVTDYYARVGDPSMTIVSHGVDGDDFDFTEMCESRRAVSGGGNSTCKCFIERRFKINNAEISRKEGDAEIWFRDELTRLKRVLDNLDQTTRTLRSWADSGLSMRVVCSKSFCRNYDPVIIGRDQLLLHADKGLSLDDFKQKLKCKVCGTRSPRLIVV